MNREKLEGLRRWFQQDESEPGSKADAQLLVAHMLELIDAFLEDDDAGCPPLPKPRIDRSLRGWVIADDSVYWANEDGLAETARGVTEFDWAWLDDEEWIVRKLTPEDIQ